MFTKLLERVKSLNLPKGQYALFGSAPILVRGLRDATHDIDIIVKKDVWDEYAKKENWKVKSGPSGDNYLGWEGEDIELWNSWRPGEWDIEKIINDAEIINGISYVRLETTLEWKKQNGREKDLKDAKLIEDHLSKK